MTGRAKVDLRHGHRAHVAVNVDLGFGADRAQLERIQGGVYRRQRNESGRRSAVESLAVVAPPIKGVIGPLSSATLASSPPSWCDVIVSLLMTRYWLGKCQRGLIWVMVRVEAVVVPKTPRLTPPRPGGLTLSTPGPLT